MAFYARKGERIEVDGRYLGTVARDLDGSAACWTHDGFSDMQVDLGKASERLPVTSWLLAKMRQARG